MLGASPTPCPDDLHRTPLIVIPCVTMLLAPSKLEVVKVIDGMALIVVGNGQVNLLESSSERIVYKK